MPRHTHAYRSLTQPARLHLLREIQRRPGVLAEDLADRLGSPLNTVRDHLKVLLDEGLIVGDPQRRASRGRPAIAYRPVTDPAESETAAKRATDAARRGALLRSTIGEPAPGGLDEQAVRQLDVVYEHLEDVGLQPRVDDRPGADAGALAIELTPCALYAGGDEYETACEVHAALVRDLLRQSSGPLSLSGVEPFSTPTRCHLTLRDGDAD